MGRAKCCLDESLSPRVAFLRLRRRPHTRLHYIQPNRTIQHTDIVPSDRPCKLHRRSIAGSIRSSRADVATIALRLLARVQVQVQRSPGPLASRFSPPVSSHWSWQPAALASCKMPGPPPVGSLKRSFASVDESSRASPSAAKIPKPDHAADADAAAKPAAEGSRPAPAPAPAPASAPLSIAGRFEVRGAAYWAQQAGARGASATFQLPTALSSFSYDAQRTLHHDDRQRKYYRVPFDAGVGTGPGTGGSRGAAPLDLNYGIERYVSRENTGVSTQCMPLSPPRAGVPHAEMLLPLLPPPFSPVARATRLPARLAADQGDRGPERRGGAAARRRHHLARHHDQALHLPIRRVRRRL